MLKRFSLKNIKYYIMVWTFFLPGLFSRGSSYNLIQLINSYATYILSFMIIFTYFFYNKFKFRYNRGYLILVLLSAPMAISTVLETGQVSSFFLPVYFRFFAWMLWIDLLEERGHMSRMLRAMSNSFIIMIVINTIGEIVLPNGFFSELTVDGGYWQQWTSIYFLGNDNTFALQYMCYLGVIIIDDYINNEKITFRTIASVIICDISVLFVWTGSGIVACLGLTVILLMAHWNILDQKYLNYKVLIPIYVVLFVLVVWNQNTGILSFLIQNILNKDITLSGRTLVWPEYISLIMDKPLLGHGIAVTEYFEFSGRARSTHNQFLQILLYGGFVSLLGYFSLIWMSLKKQYDNRHEMIGTVLTWLVLIILFCFMVEQNVFYLGQYVLLYILFTVRYNSQSVKTSSRF